MQTRLHCISAHAINEPSRKICKIISGSLKAKLCNKLLSDFHKRWVELLYFEKKINHNVTSGHYEMRFHKVRNKKKASKSLYSFIINPKSMKFHLNQSNSKMHPFTFVCTSDGVSICFSFHTEYECNAWMSMLQTLQWQYQPKRNSVIKQMEPSISRSLTTPLNSDIDDAEYNNDADIQASDEDEYDTEQPTLSAYYYPNTNLWNTNAKSCGCNDICSINKCTILDLLNTSSI